MIKTLLPIFLLLLSCSERPGREKFPGPQGRTTDVQQAEATKAVMGGFDPAKRLAPTEGQAPAESGKAKISGTISLAKDLKSKEGYYFFIAARSPEGGPPLAVKRLQGIKFPYNFELTEADAMIAGRLLQGKVTITARLKKNPDPLAQDPGDFYGLSEAEAGQTNVKIVLEER